MNTQITYKLISRHRWNGETNWSEWEENEGSSGLTIQECEMLIQEWAEGSNLKHYGNLYKVQDELQTEEFKIVDDRLCVMTHNKILRGEYFV